ncbi:MAG: hypothetical protein ABH890_07230 [Bacillota bacterium]
MKRRKLLLFNSILLTIYFLTSTIYYLAEGSTLDGFVIATAFYVIWILIHEGVILLAVILQWLGYLSNSRGWLIFSSLILIIGGIIFPISFIVIVPLLILDLFAIAKKKKTISQN